MRELQKAAQDLRDIHSGAIVEPVLLPAGGRPRQASSTYARRRQTKKKLLCEQCECSVSTTSPAVSPANAANATFKLAPAPGCCAQTPLLPQGSDRCWRSRNRGKAAGRRITGNGFYKIFVHKLALQLASARTAEVGGVAWRGG